MSDFDFFERDLAKQWREHERRIIEEGVAIAEEIEEERHLDGRRTFVKTWKFPLHVLEVGQAGIVGFSMDVTTQLSQIHLDTQILDTVDCMVFVKEYDQGRDLFVFSYVNQTVANYLAPGRTKAEMLGRSDADFVQDAFQVTEFRRYDLEVYQNKAASLSPRSRSLRPCMAHGLWKLSRSPSTARIGRTTIRGRALRPVSWAFPPMSPS